ncbi:MAG: RNA pseudouridine synthase [Verrucomicrobiales bacterium]|nr:RNA pseudouridine synthase [Verrucomicrobiales bacterium]
MAKPHVIDLPDGTQVPVVFEDRSVMILDKPAGWMVAPDEWTNTARNLSLAIREGMDLGDWWARSRNLRFLRFVHRLDAETSGLLMAVKSEGAMGAYSRLFSERRIEKRYLAAVDGTPGMDEWTRNDPLGTDDERVGFGRVDREEGRTATTRFRVLARSREGALVEACPITGRTHQIRLHLQASGYPVVGDDRYGRADSRGLGLRAVALSYEDPFRGQPVRVRAAVEEFCARFGYAVPEGFGRPVRRESKEPTPGSRGRGAATSPSAVAGPKGGTVRRSSGPSGPPGPSGGGLGRPS